MWRKRGLHLGDRVELYRARPFSGEVATLRSLSVYKLGDDDAAGGDFATSKSPSAEAIRSDFAAKPFASGCIFHTSYAAPYLHHGLVISLEYNRPRDRHRSRCCSPVAYCRSSSPVGDVESRTGMRNVRDRKTGAMMEKASTATAGHGLHSGVVRGFNYRVFFGCSFSARVD